MDEALIDWLSLVRRTGQGDIIQFLKKTFSGNKLQISEGVDQSVTIDIKKFGVISRVRAAEEYGVLDIPL